MVKVDFDAIAIEALNFRNGCFISSHEPINCKNLLLQLNVLTLYRPLSNNFSGMCLKSNEKKFILVNSNHSRGRQHFTIAHEFYHLFLEQSFTPHLCNLNNSLRDNLKEQIANTFASNLLIPEIGVRKMIPTTEQEEKNISLSTLLKLEHYFSVSHLAMLKRLMALKLITKEQFEDYSSVRIKKVAAEYGYDLSLYKSRNEGIIIGDYGTKARELFDNEKISEGFYRELLADIEVNLTEVDDGEEN